MTPPAWFSPRYLAFWVLVVLWGYLMVNVWMPELSEHRVLVSVVVVVATIVILWRLR